MLGPLNRCSLLGLAVCLYACVATEASAAFRAIPIGREASPIEIGSAGEFHDASGGDYLMVEAAPDREGFVGRMSVRARTDGSKPRWFVFALQNVSTEPIDLWLSPRPIHAGSGSGKETSPEAQIVAVTPSVGPIPERIRMDRSDVFPLHMSPGQTITYVVELSSAGLRPMYLLRSLVAK